MNLVFELAALLHHGVAVDCAALLADDWRRALVRRCKLDPSYLESAPVSNVDTEKDSGAFNLNPVSEELACATTHWSSALELKAIKVGRCTKLDPSFKAPGFKL